MKPYGLPCPACGAPYDMHSRFCCKCGKQLWEEPQPAEPLIPPLRKLRTKILFALALFLALVAFALARL